jgi:hypothetical protein
MFTCLKEASIQWPGDTEFAGHSDITGNFAFILLLLLLFIFIDGLQTEVLKIHFLAENRPAEVNLCEQLLNKRCN